ncbi:hypothetical protein [Paenibacillus paeoniae]|uniref:Uncharacterized protein n=1 Tax=Paenibacillus paeoniae TaxID=2292705 RepID=A0A371PMA4_9BACL|nr:hypothetical protein [Paenibacillus paeoniae]REK77334.1 hypothetical protein DX130_10125 [Paenibacillus paeoniae]
MDKYGDWIIMAVAGVLAVIWLYRTFYRWLHAPATMNKVKLGKGGAIADNDEHVQLLEQHGYLVVSGKHVIPIPVELDDALLGKGTRIYIDYIAEMDHLTYIVKTARERMPMDWSASGLRDRLLMYALLLPHCAGVLYVDLKEKKISKIVFHIAD